MSIEIRERLATLGWCVWPPGGGRASTPHQKASEPPAETA
jgi:hypothetical protein